MEKQASRPLLDTIERLTLVSEIGAIIGFGALVFSTLVILVADELLLSALPLGVGFALLSVSLHVKEENGTTPLFKIFPIQLPTVTDILAIVLVFGLMMGTLFGIDMIAERFGASFVRTTGSIPPLLTILSIVAVMFLFVGPVEEILFRYIIQDQLLLGTPPRRIAIASFVFGLLHLRLYIGVDDPALGAAQLVTVITLGAILGVAYEWRQNLLVPITAHAAYNTAVILLPVIHII